MVMGEARMRKLQRLRPPKVRTVIEKLRLYFSLRGRTREDNIREKEEQVYCNICLSVYRAGVNSSARKLRP